jgi:small subunit ribosomal protein S27e
MLRFIYGSPKTFIKAALSLHKGGSNMEKKIFREPTSKFLKVRCPKCKNEQIIFGNASSNVDCLVCSKEIAKPTGGKATIKARVLEVLS